MDKRTFNVAGPCDTKKNYMLDTSRRLNGDIILYIDDGQYFVIHAARQTGKSTLLLDLGDQLNASGKYYALYCSLENAYSLTDIEQGMFSILNGIKNVLTNLHFPEAYTHHFSQAVTKRLRQPQAN